MKITNVTFNYDLNNIGMSNRVPEHVKQSLTK